MALLHYLNANKSEYGVILTALNCDHGIRGESSIKDSAFVKKECERLGVPLVSFVWQTEQKRTENAARQWRLNCYKKALNADKNGWEGADVIATAHHANDNAETVLFNLARGASLSGVKGISDSEILDENSVSLSIVRPLIACTRGEIDEYVKQNDVKFVVDESNFTEDYTRNKIRLKVIPEIENAVGGAVKNIYRFSRLAAEDEEYFSRQVNKILKTETPFGYKILKCDESVIFKRAAVKIIAGYKLKDYTAEQLDRLYSLQYNAVGKKFEFLGLTAICERDGVFVCKSCDLHFNFQSVSVSDYLKEGKTEICGQELIITLNGDVKSDKKVLTFDYEKLPQNAVVRFYQSGDKFKKFGGGTKSLGDFFTDKKIPHAVRKRLPLIAVDSQILCVCGVEICDDIKVTKDTKITGNIIF